MAVDWTGYKLAPDFSGLAQGLAQYGANKRQSAQFEQELDLKNRTLAADTALRQASLGAGGQYARDVKALPFVLGEYDDKGDKKALYSVIESSSRTNPSDIQRFYRDEVTGRVIPAEEMGNVKLTPTTIDLWNATEKAAAKGKEATAVLTAERTLKPEIAGLSKAAELEAVTERGGQAELEKKLGAENATYFSALQDEAAQAIDEIPNLEATLAFSKDPNVVQGLGAKQRAFVQKVFSDPVATEKYYTSLSRMATAVLNAQTGTKTENDALRAALDNAQATNTPEANQYLLELLVAQKKKAITKARDANRLYNEGKFTKGNFLEQWGAANEAPQGAPQGEKSQAQLEYEAKRKAAGY